ncbi:MAG TPA: hypothetical protein VHS96_03310 [Bacteroidia bacterium]|nr:hypothetical protein [Bacteroidia bacterium]
MAVISGPSAAVSEAESESGAAGWHEKARIARRAKPSNVLSLENVVVLYFIFIGFLVDTPQADEVTQPLHFFYFRVRFFASDENRATER